MKEITPEIMRENIRKEIDRLTKQRKNVWDRKFALKRELAELEEKEIYFDTMINALEKSKGIILDIMFSE